MNRMTQKQIRMEIEKLQTEISDILMTDFMVVGDDPIGFVQRMIDERNAKIEELRKQLIQEE